MPAGLKSGGALRGLRGGYWLGGAALRYESSKNAGWGVIGRYHTDLVRVRWLGDGVMRSTLPRAARRGGPGPPVGGLISGVPICPYIMVRRCPRASIRGGLCGASGVATGSKRGVNAHVIKDRQDGGWSVATTQA